MELTWWLLNTERGGDGGKDGSAPDQGPEGSWRPQRFLVTLKAGSWVLPCDEATVERKQPRTEFPPVGEAEERAPGRRGDLQGQLWGPQVPD